jgi:translation initiation factor IF-1
VRFLGRETRGQEVAKRRGRFNEEAYGEAEDEDVRDDHVKLDGVVTQVFAGGQFEINTDAGAVVRARLCGRMRKYRIRVILGDRVTVALSPYDLSHGMIVFRAK